MVVLLALVETDFTQALKERNPIGSLGGRQSEQRAKQNAVLSKAIRTQAGSIYARTFYH